ncbi:MAG: alkaline phosphatase family protein [Chloroflexi bacterium]|nr:alkaline phosphatase family protein [Chloroflexota bacterium]
MLENRSFDHIFGYRPGVRGLTGNERNLLDPSRPESSSNPAYVADANAPYAVLVGQGPGHSIQATNYQLCNDRGGPSPRLPATNDGFVRNYGDELFHDRIPNPTPQQIHVVMQAFAPTRLPSINALADAFCLCDNWYSEVPGPTQPNRLYMHAATSLGAGLNEWTRQFTTRTVYDNLQANGLTWATYSFDQNEVLEFSQLKASVACFKSFEHDFVPDVQAGKLANYSFIIPRFLNSYNAAGVTHGMANSQHAPEDARYADNLIADVYEGLRASPASWASTVLIVTYDEHGGFYDHVIPPAEGVPNPDGKNSPQPGDPPYAPSFAFDRLGLRVPAIIASPWVEAGRVDSTQYQHTSVLSTVKKLFGLPGFLTKRDESANSFESVLNLSSARTDTPLTLPRVQMPQVSVSIDDPRYPANQPLDRDQCALVQRVYHLTKDSQSAGFTAAILPIRQGDAHEFVRQSLQRYLAGTQARGGVDV